MADPIAEATTGAIPGTALRDVLGSIPKHRLHVWAWLRVPAQRFIMNDWLAIAIGHDIFAWRSLDDAELAHELTHVRQWSTNGILYIARYFRAGRAARAAHNDGYRGNAFEVEAYAVQDAVRAAEAALAGETPGPPATP
jgi:hypothetical protein